MLLYVFFEYDVIEYDILFVKLSFVERAVVGFVMGDGFELPLNRLRCFGRSHSHASCRPFKRRLFEMGHSRGRVGYPYFFVACFLLFLVWLLLFDGRNGWSRVSRDVRTEFWASKRGDELTVISSLWAVMTFFVAHAYDPRADFLCWRSIAVLFAVLFWKVFSTIPFPPEHGCSVQNYSIFGFVVAVVASFLSVAAKSIDAVVVEGQANGATGCRSCKVSFLPFLCLFL